MVLRFPHHVVEMTINPFEDAPPAPAAPTRKTQAERVIAKFNGARKLAAALQRVSSRHPSRVYRWTYSTARGGTGGLIPSSAMADVFRAAVLEGVVLTADDVDPRPR